MVIDFNCTGERRKELVRAIAEATGIKQRYAGMPTQAFVIGPYTVSKTGELSFDDLVEDEAKTLLEALCRVGFDRKDTDKATGLAISFPRNKISDGGIERLKKLLDAKGELIKRALGIGDIPFEVEADRITFPWFSALPAPEEADAYSRFICALCEFAEKQKRIAARAKEVENEKYAFRCFLLRLGFIGDAPELKQARKLLLSKLSGSAAFKSGHREPKVSEEEVIPTKENSVPVDVELALKRLKDPQVQEEIKGILNGEESE